MSGGVKRRQTGWYPAAGDESPPDAGKPGEKISLDDIQDIDDRLLHQEVLACEFDKTDEEYDLIIGMDYLSLCTLIVSSGKFILCY